ncbi:MAG: rhodanese-like domain-containing protein [Burkholderiales bacterium]|nr:rhodanese-like domain-containing protein [Burkholderiales bacterium]
MKLAPLLLTTAAALIALNSIAADAPSANPQSTQAEQPWKYKVQHLDRGAIDALLAHPNEVLFLDVRRPDELITYGSFPAYLNVQVDQVPTNLAYLPRDRTIVTVSNHAQRAGKIGDYLVEQGFRVAGAAGAEEYEKAGGKSISHITAPTKPAAAVATNTVAK